MFNVKWAAFPAGAAFLLAFVVSLLIGQVGLGLALLRAAVFAALFFGIGCGTWVLVNTHLPELLIPANREPDSDGVFPSGFSAEPSAGSRINITLGDGADAALPSGPYDMEGIGNIADLVSNTIPSVSDAEKEPAGDIDQAGANGYTSELGDFSFAPDAEGDEKPEAAETGGLGDFSAFFDGITAKSPVAESDDSMADLFQSFSSGGGPLGLDEPAPPKRKIAENKPVEMQGDFSPKEIAVGLRTMLAKEKRG